MVGRKKGGMPEWGGKPPESQFVKLIFCYNLRMAFDPNRITFFARTDARGQNVAFGIKAKDRQRHVYVIGKTGMGKSTLLENMAVQDIQNGEGMAFIDPHGSAAETLLNYIPEHRVNDVLYFAPSDAAYPVSFNIMEDVGPDKRHLVVSGLMSVFKKIWVDAWSARMEYILQNTLLALLEYPESTLLGVNRMLSDKEYRNLVVANVKDPSVRAFWLDEFAKYNERYMQEAGDAVKNKIGQFTANPIIRNIIGQPKSSFDIRQIMDEKKIIIMNLSKGLIGETNANLLGSMLTTRIYLAAMSRADLSPEKMRDMPNFYFYVDEFQSFANATFANILSEARKYHLNLTIAHQYIEQMEEDVRNAVFGNVGTIITFRVGPFDAEVLETVFSPQFLATDLVNLGFAQVYLTLMIDGIGSQPFSATTLPPIAPPQISCKDMVIRASERQFAHPRDEVEVLIQKFHEPVATPPRQPKPADGNGGVAVPRAVIEKGNAVRKERSSEERPARRGVRNDGSSESDGERTVRRPPRPPVGESYGERRFEDRRHGERRQEERHFTDHPGPRPEIQERRRGEGTREQKKVPREEKGERIVPTERSGQNLEDLRSVLRKLVAEEEKHQEEPARVVHEEKTRVDPEMSPGHEVSLGDAIARIRGGTPLPKEEGLSQEHQANADATPPKHHTERERRDGVTPKELERMMRITSDDKPPH